MFATGFFLENEPMSLAQGDFSGWIIWIALRAIAADPGLWDRYVVRPGNENLLFAAEGVRNTIRERVGIRSLARSRNINLQLNAESNLVCKADPEDLELVWVNLLENAIRYSPAGATVDIRISRNNGRGTVVVEDHGPGIPDTDLPHIFERFRRADPSRTRESGGFGWGLAIAKALVEAYGGTITPESTLGQGTRMMVMLPSERK